MKPKTGPVKKEDLVIATSMLCEECFQREETTERITVRYFKSRGWKRVDGKVMCPSCINGETDIRPL